MRGANFTNDQSPASHADTSDQGLFLVLKLTSDHLGIKREQSSPERLTAGLRGIITGPGSDLSHRRSIKA